MSKIRIKRAKRLRGDADATYEVRADTVDVVVQEDLITAEGAEVLSELGGECLTAAWRPHVPLHLVQGGADDLFPTGTEPRPGPASRKA